MEPILKTIGLGLSPTRQRGGHDRPPPIASTYGTLLLGGHRECEVGHIRMRTETESKKEGTYPEPGHRWDFKKIWADHRQCAPQAGLRHEMPKLAATRPGQPPRAGRQYRRYSARTVTVAGSSWARAPGSCVWASSAFPRELHTRAASWWPGRPNRPPVAAMHPRHGRGRAGRLAEIRIRLEGSR